MKLQTTKLCVNCESLYEEIGPCPYCRSEVFVWLFQALGTVIENDPDLTAGSPLPMNKEWAPHAQVHPSTATFPQESVMHARSFTEFRAALGKMGREMIRFLTFGAIHAYNK